MEGKRCPTRTSEQPSSRWLFIMLRNLKEPRRPLSARANRNTEYVGKGYCIMHAAFPDPGNTPSHARLKSLHAPRSCDSKTRHAENPNQISAPSITARNMMYNKRHIKSVPVQRQHMCLPRPVTQTENRPCSAPSFGRKAQGVCRAEPCTPVLLSGIMAIGLVVALRHRCHDTARRWWQCRDGLRHR